MNVVLDGSVVVKLLYPEPWSDTAMRLAADAARLRWRIVAPVIMRAGVTNVIRRRAQSEGRSLAAALQDLDALLDLPIDVVDVPVLYPAGLRLAFIHNVSFYDAMYVTLAQSLGCDLWTDDQRVLRALAGRLPFVRWIGDYSSLD